MRAARIQPFTVIAVALFVGIVQSWWVSVLFGAVMLIGAVKPELNLLDRWISLLSRTEHRTTLYPKRFATGMGGGMLIAAGLLGWASLTSAALALVGLTVAAASLQGIFNLCIGCWIFNAMVRLTSKSERNGEPSPGTPRG